MEAEYVEYPQITNGPNVPHADIYVTETKSSYIHTPATVEAEYVEYAQTINGPKLSHADRYFTETKSCSILAPVTVERAKECMYTLADPDGGRYDCYDKYSNYVEGEGRTRTNFCIIRKKKIVMSFLFVIIVGGALGAGVVIGTEGIGSADVGVATSETRKDKSTIPLSTTNIVITPTFTLPTTNAKTTVSPGFVRSAKGQHCEAKIRSQIKVFIPPSSSDSDAIKVRNDCENYCLTIDSCWGCSIHCENPCQWIAFTECGKKISWSGKIEGDITQKVYEN